MSLHQNRISAGEESLSDSPRIFSNDLLDKLSRVHYLTPVVIYGPLILAIGCNAVLIHGTARALAWAFLGLMGWSLVEYLGHRFLFHTVLNLPFGWGPRLQFLVHGVHHIYPNDPYRLVMPPLLSAPIVLMAMGVIRLVFGADLMWPILAGFLLGYLSYDCVHYWIHHGSAKSRFGQHMRRLHMRHHFHDSTRNFGVLSVWWDHFFRTSQSATKRRH